MEEKGLKSTTIGLMIGSALLFDGLQALLTPIFLGWAVGIFAFLTFWLWFRMYGISFMRPKRLATMGAASIIEMIPFLSVIPAWTFAVAYLAISSKAKETISSVGGIKKDNNIPFPPKRTFDRSNDDDNRMAA